MPEVLTQQLALVGLPDEILLKILSYLDFRQIGQTSRTCTRLYILAQDSRFPVTKLVADYQNLPMRIRKIVRALKFLQEDSFEYLQQDNAIYTRIQFNTCVSLVLAVAVIKLIVIYNLPTPQRRIMEQFYAHQPITFCLLLVGIFFVSCMLILACNECILSNTYPRYRGHYTRLFRDEGVYFRNLEGVKKEYELILDYYQPFIKGFSIVDIDSNFIFQVPERPERINQALQFLQVAKKATPDIIQHLHNKASVVSQVAQHYKARVINLPSFFSRTLNVKWQAYTIKSMRKPLAVKIQTNGREKKDESSEQVESVAHTYFKRLYHA